MIEPEKIVIVKAPDFVKGEKIGIVIRPCKDHEGSWIVQLLDPNITTKTICVGRSDKDSIKLG
jgi:hypothetical protein